MSKHSKAIIFGSNGQDGYYLNRLFEREGIQSVCISRNGNVLHGDVTDYNFVEAQIKENHPAYIFNFAAHSTTDHRVLFENHATICNGTLNILEAARLHCPDARIFIPGSGVQFKNDGTPINEQTPFEASTPYAVARIQSVYASRYYRRRFGLRVYVGYLFNHDSPLRAEVHVNQKIVKAALRVAAGSTDKLELGNIEVRKEFNYARDVVEGMWILINQEKVSEAVIGSGKAHSIREWLEYCFGRINKRWQDYVEQTQNFVTEYETLVCDPSLIRGLGWRETTDMKQLADIMLGNLPED